MKINSTNRIPKTFLLSTFFAVGLSLTKICSDFTPSVEMIDSHFSFKLLDMERRANGELASQMLVMLVVFLTNLFPSVIDVAR